MRKNLRLTSSAANPVRGNSSIQPAQVAKRESFDLTLHWLCDSRIHNLLNSNNLNNCKAPCHHLHHLLQSESCCYIRYYMHWSGSQQQSQGTISKLAFKLDIHSAMCRFGARSWATSGTNLPVCESKKLLEYRKKKWWIGMGPYFRKKEARWRTEKDNHPFWIVPLMSVSFNTYDWGCNEHWD